MTKHIFYVGEDTEGLDMGWYFLDWTGSPEGPYSSGGMAEDAYRVAAALSVQFQEELDEI